MESKAEQPSKVDAHEMVEDVLADYSGGMDRIDADALKHLRGFQFRDIDYPPPTYWREGLEKYLHKYADGGKAEVKKALDDYMKRGLHEEFLKVRHQPQSEECKTIVAKQKIVSALIGKCEETTETKTPAEKAKSKEGTLNMLKDKKAAQETFGNIFDQIRYLVGKTVGLVLPKSMRKKLTAPWEKHMAKKAADKAAALDKAKQEYQAAKRAEKGEEQDDTSTKVQSTTVETPKAAEVETASTETLVTAPAAPDSPAATVASEQTSTAAKAQSVMTTNPTDLNDSRINSLSQMSGKGNANKTHVEASMVVNPDEPVTFDSDGIKLKPADKMKFKSTKPAHFKPFEPIRTKKSSGGASASLN